LEPQRHALAPWAAEAENLIPSGVAGKRRAIAVTDAAQGRLRDMAPAGHANRSAADDKHNPVKVRFHYK
jgi:hypothetical protein